MPPTEKTFRRYDPDQMMLLPTDPRKWLPEDHLVYFISDLVEELELSAIHARYRPAPGYPPYDPEMMAKVLIYAYCIGMRSSRRVASAIHENIAFRVLAAGNFPDFRTICRFRVDHSEAFRTLFRQVLQLYEAEGLLNAEVAALDGTKVRANANMLRNRNKAELEKERNALDDAVRRIRREADETYAREDSEFGEENGNPLPITLRRRDGRRKRISDALRQIKEEEERREAELKDKIEKRRQLEETERAKGKKVRGRMPKFEKETKPITRNPTDVDSRRMISSVGYLQGYNAQIVVDCDSQVILAEDVVQDRNDEQQLLPMLEKARQNMGRAPAKLLADSGYFSSKAVQSVRDVDLYIATQLTYHVRKGVPPRMKKREPTLMEKMATKLLTEEGHALFSRRSRTVECCFGNIKENRGMRRFLLRGGGQGEMRVDAGMPRTQHGQAVEQTMSLAMGSGRSSRREEAAGNVNGRSGGHLSTHHEGLRSTGRRTPKGVPGQHSPRTILGRSPELVTFQPPLTRCERVGEKTSVDTTPYAPTPAQTRE
ncbi:MAG: IS1182 family transposase [Thermoplasmata archaeon]